MHRLQQPRPARKAPHGRYIRNVLEPPGGWSQPRAVAGSGGAARPATTPDGGATGAMMRKSDARGAPAGAGARWRMGEQARRFMVGIRYMQLGGASICALVGASQ